MWRGRPARVRQLQRARTPVVQFYRKRPPRIAPRITRTQGAIFQNCKPLNKITAREKLFGESIALVQIGWYSAASNMPTTAAFAPANNAWAAGDERRRFQRGSRPFTKSIGGRRIAKRHHNPASQPVGFPTFAAPRYAANENNGP